MSKMKKSSQELAITKTSALPTTYPIFLSQLKERIQQARVKAALSVNRELIFLYWEIGKAITERQKNEGWGKSIVDRLSSDIQRAFPGIEGFSPSNIWRMRSFYLAWTDVNLARPVRELRDIPNLAQLVQELDGAQLPSEIRGIPWGHNIALLQKLDHPALRLWYAKQTVEHGWSRNVLAHQIEAKLHKRQGKALTNFSKTLPSPQSDLAQAIIKDPYNFDFLNLTPEAQEREIETHLAAHIQKFLIELGVGFAFVGRQYHLEVGGEDFYIDLLFYHLKLRCYVVIELKTGKFKPDHAGQLNFYLSTIDATLKHSNDNPSIGMILCKDKNKFIAEYALRDMTKPIGVSEYKLVESIPAKFKSSLPSIKELEAEFKDLKK